MEELNFQQVIFIHTFNIIQCSQSGSVTGVVGRLTHHNMTLMVLVFNSIPSELDIEK